METRDIIEILTELQNQNLDLLDLFESLDTSFRNQATTLNIDFFNVYSQVYKADRYENRAELLDKYEQNVQQLQNTINLQAKEAKEAISERTELMKKNLEAIKSL